MIRRVTKTTLTFFVFYLILTAEADGQGFTQTMYGTIKAKASLTPLEGAVITVLDLNPAIGTTSSFDGVYRLDKVPVGRHRVMITYVGYLGRTIDNVLVTTGKQVNLDIYLEESPVLLQEIVVSGSGEKNKPINTMTLAGGRMFSVEETQKFAASFNDPLRMVTSYPGVVQIDDINNSIAVRGNSPNGLLWRLEGIDIPNPNHFSSVGTSGGGISALSAQVLSNSDFLNGAFNAEYGNVLSGVFDLRLRKGNTQKQEYTFQVGFIGADASIEGPFKKGYRGSYLVNYRYSTLKLISALGVDIDDNSKFQDVSFNIFLPTKKYGDFSIFGIGGISSQKEDRTLFDIINGSGLIRFKAFNASNTGALGLSNLKIMSHRFNIKSTIALTGYKIAQTNETSQGGNIHELLLTEKNNYIPKKLAVSSVANIWTSTNNVIRTGITGSLLGYSLLEGKKDFGATTIFNKIQESGNTTMVNSFVEYLFNLTSRFSANTGIHFSFFGLNQSKTVEPRLSLKYDVSAKHSLSFGYGLHSQVQPLGVYFIRTENSTGKTVMPNRQLGFSKAHHLIGSYNFAIDAYHKIKLEGYYQTLFDIPVSPDSTRPVSILNETEGYLNEVLVNEGFGKNYGLELTFERFLKNNFYYVLSSSVFESKYKTKDNVWRNTRFNGNYTFAFTGGHEIPLKKNNRSYLGFNLKGIYVGGLRTTPIDLDASQKKGSVVYYDLRAFEKKLPDYNRLDFKMSLRKNFSHFTLTSSLDIQNILNVENAGKEFYDPLKKDIRLSTQNGIIPVISMKVEF